MTGIIVEGVLGVGEGSVPLCVFDPGAGPDRLSRQNQGWALAVLETTETRPFYPPVDCGADADRFGLTETEFIFLIGG